MLSVLIWFREEIQLSSLEKYLCREFPWKNEMEGFRVLNKEEWDAEDIRGAKRYLGVRVHGAFRLFETAEIDYLEKEGRVIRIHLENGECHLFYGKFAEVLPALGAGFCQCHKSYVVNLAKVREVRRYVFCMKGGEMLPVSQKKYRQAKEQVDRYIEERKRQPESSGGSRAGGE